MKFTVKLLICVAAACVLLFSFLAAALATPTLAVSFYKDNGYGLGNDKQGVWTVNAVVSENTTRVEFFLDGQLELNDTESPFSWTFDTGNYALGLHTIKVVAYDSAGESASVEKQPNFVGFPWSLIWSIIGLCVALFAVALAISVYKIKKEAKKRRAQNS
jgi:hypothetical protein